MAQVESALALHRAGDLQAAHKIYRSVLKRHPANSDALHYLGVLLHQTGQHEEAERLIVRALKIDPRQAFAHNNLGEVYRAQGKYERAAASYRSAIALSCDYPEALNNLGLCLSALGESDEAVSVLCRAVALQPDFAEAWIHLGNVYKDQGSEDLATSAYEQIPKTSALYVDAQLNLAGLHLHFERTEESLRQYQSICELSPSTSRAWVGVGEANYKLGHLTEAIAALQRAASLDPSVVDTTLMLSECLREDGRLDEAQACLNRAIVQAPGESRLYEQLISILEARDDTKTLLQICRTAIDNRCLTWRIHAGYAAALRSKGSLQEALKQAELGVELEANIPETHNVLGLCLAALGKEDEAIESFTTALNCDQYHIATLNNLATSYLSRGDKGLARQFLSKALGVDPDYAPALENRSSLEPLNLDETEQVLRIKRLADAQSTLISHRASLHFVLAKAFENASMFDEAFEHYSAGNRLRAQSSPYSPAKHEEEIQANIRVFDQAFIDRGFPGASSSRRPIFIVGMPRSGTTLVEQILSSHPDVYGAGELSYFHEIQFRHRESGKVLPYWLCVESFDEEAVEGLAEGYLSMLREISADKLHVTDKLPMNYFHLGLIHMIFPNARIIHCARNAYDTCISIFRQNFTFGNDYARDLFDIGHRYRQQVRIMNHWREVIRERIYDLSYERLVESAEAETRPLVEFCGLSWNDACLRPADNKRAVKTASQLQVREPIHNKAMAQWKDYEPHLAELERGLATDLSPAQ